MAKRMSSFRLVLFFFRPYKLQVALLVALSVLAGALEAINIAAIYPILSATFNMGAEGITLSLLAKVAALVPVEDKLIAYCVVFLLLATLTFAARLAVISFSAKFGARLVEENQRKAFDSIIKADYQYFVDHKQGDLVYNVASAPQRLMSLVSATTQLISQAVLSLSLIVLLVSLSWQGAAAVVLIGVGYHYLTRYLGKKVSYRAGENIVSASRESTVILNESISGIRQVKVYLNAQRWIQKFGSAVNKLWSNYARRAIWQQVPTAALMFVLYLSVGVVVMLIRTVSPASFVELLPVLGTFVLALFRLFPIMGNFGGLTMQIMGAIPACEAVYSVQENIITHIKDGAKELGSFKSAVKLNGVTFAYKGRSGTLEDVSASFERGRVTAIVGRSGSGKTTIINLLLRLYEPDKGEVEIDGLDIKEYKLPSWLSKIGLVSQETFVFNDTVKNNIAFYSNGHSDEEIVEAAKYADAHSFISELPQGYDTLLGDKGIRISAGQRQRIAIARAMLRKPEVLIFDEATSALDNISEAAVQEAIDKVSEGHTVIVVAHRLSTIVGADKIIVLGDGQILEEGTHKELMAKQGAYWQLYRGQST